MTSEEAPIRLPIDWDELEVSVERNAPDADGYLDLTTGAVVSVVNGEPEAAHLRATIAANIRNYLRIEPASSREQYRWMERFVGSVTDEPLRERMQISIDGKGAFRRFKDVLLGFPVERERWFSYRSNLLRWHIQGWLAAHQIEPTNPPPWGLITEPTELPSAPARQATATEAPGEVLRRQARDLIEQIPAIELPTAIAFLDFLRSRGQDPGS